MDHVIIRSSLDSTNQPCGIYVPCTTSKIAVPLAIGLHQWSYDFTEQTNAPAFEKQCRKRRWAFAYPNFRGPNNQPEACGSDLAVGDILDAVKFMRENYNIDEKRIYLIGASGGGMMALLMAGRAPDLWAGVSGWVGILDIAKWHAEGITRNNGYPEMMAACCGGAPNDSPATKKQYRKRSPKTYLMTASALPMDINAGIHDGHDGSVPISHSLEAFNILAEASGHGDKKISREHINYMVENQEVPPSLVEPLKDEPGRMHKVLFRRQAGCARITIFEGGHEIDPASAFRWLETITV